MVCKNLYLRIFDFPGCKVFLTSLSRLELQKYVPRWLPKEWMLGCLGVRSWLGFFHVCCSNLMRCVFHRSLGSCFPFRLSICQSVWTLSAGLKLSCMMTSVCWVVIQLVHVEVESQFSIIPNLRNIDKSHYLKCTKKYPFTLALRSYLITPGMFKSWTATQSDMTLGGISLTCGNQTFWSYDIGIRSHFKHVATALFGILVGI